MRIPLAGFPPLRNGTFIADVVKIKQLVSILKEFKICDLWITMFHQKMRRKNFKFKKYNEGLFSPAIFNMLLAFSRVETKVRISHKKTI